MVKHVMIISGWRQPFKRKARKQHCSPVTVDGSEIQRPTTVWMVLKPCKQWDICHINWLFGISSIHSRAKKTLLEIKFAQNLGRIKMQVLNNCMDLVAQIPLRAIPL